MGNVARNTFTARAYYDGDVWSVTVEGLPSMRTTRIQATTCREAKAMTIKQVARVLGVPAATVYIDLRIV